ncbi:SDR family NAD(P)-dependent oxidoreductase [Ramlibacter sp.]|uniref:SDR family NAD(P)-dependent oxidoreductase n=1 Tax=Ramlibacter sp. TaxID=1917967 RepID=UPI003D0B23A0
MMRAPLDWMRNSPLQGLAALVVGGGSGIGEAVCRTLAANGASVAIGDIAFANAQQVASSINDDNGGKGSSEHAIALPLDISNPDDIAAGVAKTVASFGRLDIVVDCAAIVFAAKLEDCTPQDWRRSFDVNVLGALLLARACLPHLRNSPAASIVNVSTLGWIWGRPNSGPYAPSKGALTTLTRQMALEWAEYGVRVNAVNPGTILTPLARATLPEAVRERRARDIPLGRLGTPREMADLIVFLASPAASYITAQAFNCDGGHSQALFRDVDDPPTG